MQSLPEFLTRSNAKGKQLGLESVTRLWAGGRGWEKGTAVLPGFLLHPCPIAQPHSDLLDHVGCGCDRQADKVAQDAWLLLRTPYPLFEHNLNLS